MQISSARNPLLQKVRRAASSGRPAEDGSIAIEGPHLLAEALQSSWRLGQVFTTPAGRNRHQKLLAGFSGEIIEVPARTFASFSSTQTSQEILTLVTPRVSTWQEVIHSPGIVVVLDGVQDPGNAGTIVRSAEAFGSSGIVFLGGCVQLANGKFLRATAGSIFRLPFLAAVTPNEFLAQMAGRRKLYALAAKGETVLTAVDLRQSCALIVGNEGSGVSPELLAASVSLRIPTRRVESLNAAMACSVALFEAARQRTFL
jgi:RNA methyltransferase, TrmH family